MAKILRMSEVNHKAQFLNLSAFVCQKLIFRHYHIENVKARILIPVYKNNKDRVAHFSQFI